MTCELGLDGESCCRKCVRKPRCSARVNPCLTLDDSTRPKDRWYPQCHWPETSTVDLFDLKALSAKIAVKADRRQRRKKVKDGEKDGKKKEKKKEKKM